LWLGWSTNMTYVRAFASVMSRKMTASAPSESNEFEGIVIGRVRDLDPAQAENQQGVGVSLRGTLTNLLTPAPALKKRGDEPRTVNVLSLDPAQAARIANACALILLLVTIVLTFAARSDRNAYAQALSWSLVCVAMVLISPLTRIAHLVVLILPVATLIALLQNRLRHGAAQKLAWISLIILSVGGALLSGSLVGERNSEFLRALGFTTFALLLMYAALAMCLLQLRTRVSARETFL
jgi:hypothetical protein